MAAEFFAVGFRAAENLAEEGSDMQRVVAGHVAEHRLQQRVVEDLVVEHAGQPVQRFAAARPFVKCRYLAVTAVSFLIAAET